MTSAELMMMIEVVDDGFCSSLSSLVSCSMIVHQCFVGHLVQHGNSHIINFSVNTSNLSFIDQNVIDVF